MQPVVGDTALFQTVADGYMIYAALFPAFQHFFVIQNLELHRFFQLLRKYNVGKSVFSD
jgi:hypothetical protein